MIWWSAALETCAMQQPSSLHPHHTNLFLPLQSSSSSSHPAAPLSLFLLPSLLLFSSSSTSSHSLPPTPSAICCSHPSPLPIHPIILLPLPSPSYSPSSSHPTCQPTPPIYPIFLLLTLLLPPHPILLLFLLRLSILLPLLHFPPSSLSTSPFSSSHSLYSSSHPTPPCCPLFKRDGIWALTGWLHVMAKKREWIIKRVNTPSPCFAKERLEEALKCLEDMNLIFK